MGGGLKNILNNVDPEMLSMSGSIKKLGTGTVLLWVFSVLPGGVTNQLYFQRVCAIKEEKEIPASLAISAFLAFLSFVWAVYMGMSISTMNTELAQSTATGWFMAQLPLLAAFAALVFAVMMSTVSSGAQSVVVNITRDILAVLKPDIPSDKMLKLSRTLSLVTMVVAVLMCLVFTDTLTWLVATYAFSAATLLCPIYVGYVYRNKKFITRQGLIASMVAGCVGCAVAMAMKTAINYAVYGYRCILHCADGSKCFDKGESCGRRRIIFRKRFYIEELPSMYTDGVYIVLKERQICLSFLYGEQIK